MQPSSFDSAPADLRDKWKTAAAYAEKSDYLGAVTNLISIYSRTQELSAAQNETLNQVWLELGNKAFVAANKGDKVATEAVLKIQDSKIGASRSGR